MKKMNRLNVSYTSHKQMNGTFCEESLSLPSLDDLEKLDSNSNPHEVEDAILKYTGAMSSCVDQLKSIQQEQMPKVLNHVHDMIRKAWAVPIFGHDLVDNLCNVLRMNGGLDILLDNCSSTKDDLKLSSAKLLEQCLTQENRGYVVENALQKVVQVACNYTKESQNPDHSRVGTGILEHLFKHNEMTCTDVVKLGGLEAVIRECRKTDVETLRHCAGALANLSLYGGAENQEQMIKRKVPYWLFPLAFHNDDNIKYYAFLAIAALVANKEIEGQVRNSEALNLVEPFVNSHDPILFATTCATHRHGQNKNWLERLVPILTSEKEEARNLAAFHFAMEAGIKVKRGQKEIFKEIGAVEPLKRIASSPSPIASKYAAQALRIIGEEVPHKLTPQVPLWSVEDVRQWVKQVMGFLLCSFHDGLDLSSNYLTVKARTVHSVNVDTQRLSLLDS
ncbi:NAD(+) hydrolase sarm1-like isoform X1 [Artemia franciscana]|uniref:NAD(+) hydrolase sarm1-like isoform X1 n=1 Tax=Artemia franciscana TaxID=6661 RepID=UPI0032DB2326